MAFEDRMEEMKNTIPEQAIHWQENMEYWRLLVYQMKSSWYANC